MATAKKSAGAKKAAAKKSSAKSGAKSASKGAAKKGAAKGGAAKGGAAKKSAAKSAGKSASKGGAKKASGGSKSAAKKSGGGTKRTLNPALAAPMRPSPELAAVIGSDPVPRSEVAKRIWAYLHKNGLQDQQNRRNINADDRLRTVFGGKNQVSMFEMTSLVNKHLSNA